MLFLFMKRVSGLLFLQIIEMVFFANHVSWCIFCLPPPPPVFCVGPLSFWLVSSICGFCDWVLTLNVTGSQFVFATVDRLDHQFQLYKWDGGICNVDNLELVQWTLDFLRKKSDRALQATSSKERLQLQKNQTLLNVPKYELRQVAWTPLPFFLSL